MPRVGRHGVHGGEAQLRQEGLHVQGEVLVREGLRRFLSRGGWWVGWILVDPSQLVSLVGGGRSRAQPRPTNGRRHPHPTRHADARTHTHTHSHTRARARGGGWGATSYARTMSMAMGLGRRWMTGLRGSLSVMASVPPGLRTRNICYHTIGWGWVPILSRRTVRAMLSAAALLRGAALPSFRPSLLPPLPALPPLFFFFQKTNYCRHTYIHVCACMCLHTRLASVAMALVAAVGSSWTTKVRAARSCEASGRPVSSACLARSRGGVGRRRSCACQSIYLSIDRSIYRSVETNHTCQSIYRSIDRSVETNRGRERRREHPSIIILSHV